MAHYTVQLTTRLYSLLEFVLFHYKFELINLLCLYPTMQDVLYSQNRKANAQRQKIKMTQRTQQNQLKIRTDLASYIALYNSIFPVYLVHIGLLGPIQLAMVNSYGLKIQRFYGPKWSLSLRQTACAMEVNQNIFILQLYATQNLL